MTPPDPSPQIVELKLSRHYRFMYENFVVATQSAIYQLLEKTNDAVNLLYFDSPQLQ